MESFFEEDNIQSWLAVSGFIFPRSNEEITIFNQLHKGYLFENDPSLINPLEILKMTSPIERKMDTRILPTQIQQSIDEGLKMAARGKTDIPKEILDKMKKNQQRNDKPQ